MKIFAEVPGWRERAKDELGETDERRETLLNEFKEIVSGITDFNPRLDDNFLLRFLRAKKYDMDRALYTYKRYFRIRLVDPDHFMPVGKGPKDYQEGFELQYSYVKYLPFSAIRALVMALQDGYPVRFKGIHVLNNTAVWSVIYNMARPLLKEKQQRRFHLHGTDLDSLHRYIPKDILPKEYGGHKGDFSYSWLIENLYANHDKYVRESYYGYV